MTTVNIHEAKTHLSRLLERASNGERIIIAKAGRPIAELGPLTRKPIRFGSLAGQWTVDDEAFEAADAEIRESFDPELFPDA